MCYFSYLKKTSYYLTHVTCNVLPQHCSEQYVLYYYLGFSQGLAWSLEILAENSG